MEEKVLERIRSRRLIKEGDRVLVGVSGGADSLALLTLLFRHSDELKISVACVHVHHGIRKRTADRDENFVTDYCRRLGIPCMTYHVDAVAWSREHGLSLEEAARFLRYRAFQDAAEGSGAMKIALAHHRDDQAETVLFNMIRGSGLKGLSGMEDRRRADGMSGFTGKKTMIIRPFLGLERREIEDWMRSQGLSWCEDETNAADDASRNRIRHHVIPELKKIRPDAVAKIAETAEYLREADEYLKAQAYAWSEEHIHVNEEKEVVIEADAMRRLPDLMRGYAAAEALKNLGSPMKDVSREHLRIIADLSEKAVGKTADLPYEVRAVRRYTDILMYFKKNEAAVSEAVRLPEMKLRTFPFEKGMKIPDSEYTKWFDYDKIDGRPVLRTRKTGDIFSTFPGTHKKLKDFFIDLKVPKEERDRVILAASGSDILWVIGYRMSEEYKITEDTKRVLEISITEA